MVILFLIQIKIYYLLVLEARKGFLAIAHPMKLTDPEVIYHYMRMLNLILPKNSC